MNHYPRITNLQQTTLKISWQNASLQFASRLEIIVKTVGWNFQRINKTHLVTLWQVENNWICFVLYGKIYRKQVKTAAIHLLQSLFEFSYGKIVKHHMRRILLKILVKHLLMDW